VGDRGSRRERERIVQELSQGANAPSAGEGRALIGHATADCASLSKRVPRSPSEARQSRAGELRDASPTRGESTGSLGSREGRRRRIGRPAEMCAWRRTISSYRAGEAERTGRRGKGRRTKRELATTAKKSVLVSCIMLEREDIFQAVQREPGSDGWAVRVARKASPRDERWLL